MQSAKGSPKRNSWIRLCDALVFAVFFKTDIVIVLCV